MTPKSLSQTPSPTAIAQHWRGEYHNNRTLDGSPSLIRHDADISFFWGDGSPAPGQIDSDEFSIRWTRSLDLPAGDYRFTMTVDDGGRLYVQGHLLIDAWKNQPQSTYMGRISLPGGPVAVQMEYYEDQEHAAAQLSWDQIRASPPVTGWRTYSNPYFAVALQHPRDWQRVPEYGGPESGDRFAGMGGFFMVNAVGDPDAVIDDIAAHEAQHKLRPYGSQPTIESLEIEGQEARLILPSADAHMEEQAALIIRYPRPVGIGGATYEFFVLYADQDHIRAIGQTLDFGTTPSPTEGPAVWQELPPGLVYRTPDALWQIGPDEMPLKVSHEPEAVLSPDGTRILSYDAGGRDVWVIDLAEGTEWSLAQIPDRVVCCLRWWPERPDVVLFSSERKDAEPSPGMMGYLTAADVDGRGWRILDEAHDTGPGQYGPSPDGQTIAYGGGSTGWLYRWETGPEAFDPADYGLTGSKGIRIGSPAWSPDSKRLAWVVGGGLSPDGDWRIATGVFALEARTSYLLHPYVPAGRGGWPPAPAWSPDGRWLVLVTWDHNARAPGLWVVLSDGGEGEYELGRGDSPVWSPDGQWLAFNGAPQSGESRILLAQAGTWELRPLDLPPGARLVDWSSPLKR